VLPTIPKDQRNRVAHFLEKQGFKPQALSVTCDPEHKFELALQLADLQVAYQIASEQDVSVTVACHVKPLVNLTIKRNMKVVKM